VLTLQSISFQRQYLVNVFFGARNVGEFRADLVIESAAIIELTALQKLDVSHEKQVLNYLRATNFEVGFLLISAQTLKSAV
jgi:GxxExxY protein